MERWRHSCGRSFSSAEAQKHPAGTETRQPHCMWRGDPYTHFPFLGRWNFHFLREEGKGTVLPQGDSMDGGTHAGRQYGKGPNLKRHFQMRGARCQLPYQGATTP